MNHAMKQTVVLSLIGLSFSAAAWRAGAYLHGRSQKAATVAYAFESNPQKLHPASFRVLLGVTDTRSTRWDGTLEAREAGAIKTEGWRFEGDDNFNDNVFHFYTHPARGFEDVSQVVANGFIINADDVNESSEFRITTARGDFSFRASEIPYGQGVYKLGGRVYIDRIPAAQQLTDTPEEEDYPATANAPNGDVWLTYVQFHHAPDHVKLRADPPRSADGFKDLSKPTGGDQIWVQKFSAGAWQQPVAVTDAGNDQYRPSVAVDGSNRAWVFWAENHGSNFDIYARSVGNSGPQERVQITTEAGSDIDPVAATDASGTVWVAWQGWHNGRAAIYTSHQNGKSFTPPEKITNSDKNEWNPAIATDKTGRIAVAWDSYRNGNYDVYARIDSGGKWGQETPIAATARYEAYPSIAFDPRGRLWVAYEEGGKGWGKDLGTYASSGIALYKGRAIRLRGLEPDGRLVALDAPLDTKLVGTPTLQADQTGTQTDSQSFDPVPANVLKRLPDDGNGWPEHVASNSLPRLSIDGTGRFWLAFRTAHPIWWNPIGSVWTENLLSFDGKDWTKPIFINHSDNLLDNRPALAALGNGKLLIVNSSDGRRNYQIGEKYLGDFGLKEDATADPYNNDLWSHQVDLGPANQVIPVTALSGAESRPAAPTWDQAVDQGTKAIRDFKGGANGEYHIVRGEFHRHSEISQDGGGDGTILDQWRYAIDAADLDWIGCCDHDNGDGREYSWWITQKQTDIFLDPGRFTPLFSYERSVSYPEGHRNVLFAERGVRPLPRLPLSDENKQVHAPDTQQLYEYLRKYNGVVAVHTSATGMGTDWRDNDPNVEPAVEIFQGCRQSYEIEGGPRAASEKDAVDGWRPAGFVRAALDRGYRLGFEASSDHISTHISYANAIIKGPATREAILDAFRKRHIYAATDEILADVESGDHLAGDEFATNSPPSFHIKLSGTSKFAKVTIVRDGKYVYSTAPNTAKVDFTWRDNQPNKGKTSYYYVRGEQDNGEIVWVSPFWIAYNGE